MKITTERLKEIIKEELGQMRSPEYNGEASMMKSQLFKISNYARELHNMIGDDDNLPEWMQSKIAQIDQMIGSREMNSCDAVDRRPGSWKWQSPNLRDMRS